MFTDDEQARTYATSQVDALRTALASGSAEAVMAVYRRISADGHPDAADDLIAQVITAGIRNLAAEQ